MEVFCTNNKYFQIVVHLIVVSVTISISQAENACQAQSHIQKWFDLFNNTQHTLQENKHLVDVDPSFDVVINPMFSEPVLDRCYALTFKNYVQDIVRAQDHKRLPRTWIDTAYVYNFTGFDDLEEKSKKIYCPPRNLTGDYLPQVLIVNSTTLLEKLGNKNDTVTSHYCAVVMFYAPWCPFCAKLAPQYNALARAFPTLDVYAIDALSFSKFGTVAVPNILIFHQSKAVARFNVSERTLENLRSFVKNVTGVSFNESVEVEEQDYIGPLSSVPADDPDYFLWFSWAFVILFTCTCFARSTIGKSLWSHVENYIGHIERAHIE